MSFPEASPEMAAEFRLPDGTIGTFEIFSLRLPGLLIGATHDPECSPACPIPTPTRPRVNGRSRLPAGFPPTFPIIR
jgi:hypothetical protein